MRAIPACYKLVQRARSLCGNTAVMYVLVVRVYAYVRVGAMGCHLSKVVTIAHLEMLTNICKGYQQFAVITGYQVTFN